MLHLRSLLLMFPLLFAQVLIAQSAKRDSITHRYDSIGKTRLSHLDSSQNKANYKIDSLQEKLNKLFHPNLNTVSGKNKTRLQKRKENNDSLQFVKELQAEKQRVKNKIDSLDQSGEPTALYQRQWDSLNSVTYSPSKNQLTTTRQDVNHKLDSLKSLDLSTHRFTSRVDSLSDPDGLKQLNSTKQNINNLEQKVTTPAAKIENGVNEKLVLMSKESGAGANLPGNANLPNATLPNASLPNSSLPNATIDNPLAKINNSLPGQEKLSEIKNTPAQQMSKVKGIDEIQSAQNKFSQANKLTDKAQAIGSDAKNIAQGDLSEVKELPKVAEQQVEKIDELQGLQKETGTFDQYQNMADKAKDPEALKEEAMKQASTVAIDHFAGKEEVLKGAMDKMGKLKSKYSSLSSLKDVPKHKPNEMKGKPLIERVMPGITFQFQKSDYFIMDYNPYIGYRFYIRFTAGMGWNERMSIGKHMSFSLRDRIYGPRVFADFKLAKGFSIHTDIEKMNTYVPALTSNGYSTDTEYRAWVWSAFIGLKKEYAFIKKVKGNAQFLYNLYDDHNNSPYADRFAVRMGFEFPMKRKVKVKKDTSN